VDQFLERANGEAVDIFMKNKYVHYVKQNILIVSFSIAAAAAIRKDCG